MDDAQDNDKNLDRLSLITVKATHRAEVAADSADLSITVRGTALISGSIALQKSREVYVLVESLKRIGIAESAIQIKSISADVSNGIVVRASARYVLVIKVKELEKISDIISVLTESKNTTLNGIDWLYPQESDQMNTWLALCAAQASQRAEQIAQALGVTLQGIYRYKYEVLDSEMQLAQYGGARNRSMAYASAPAGSAIAQPDLDITHSKNITVQAEAVFHVG